MDLLSSVCFTCRGHLRRIHKPMSVEENDIKPPTTSQPLITRGICVEILILLYCAFVIAHYYNNLYISMVTGYLFYAEPRTFGTSWIRLYFYIKNGQLLSQEVSV